MKESQNDKILKKMLKLQAGSVGKIIHSLKGTAPFAAKPIPKDDLIYAKNTIGSQVLEELSKEYGMESVNRLMFEIKQMEIKQTKDGKLPPTIAEA